MLSPKEFYLWLDGYIENINGNIPTASQWTAIKRKILEVNYEKESCTQILSNMILEDIPNQKTTEEKDESMTVLYGVFPEGDTGTEDKLRNNKN